MALLASLPRPAVTLGVLAVALALVLDGCAAHRAQRPERGVDGDGLRELASGAGVAGAERVRFPSRDPGHADGAPIQLLGWLFRPPGPGPFPAVVALHGCGGLYARRGDLSPRHRQYAERLARTGHVVLFPDSFTSRGVDEICSRRDREIRPWRERTADAYGALQYLQTLPFVRPDRIALLGWSNGGSTVLATVRPENPWRPPDLARDFRAAIALYPGCAAALRQPHPFPPVAPVHVLIGSADDWTPAAPCIELAERARAEGAPLDLVVYDGAYHDFDAPGMPLRVRESVATTASGTAHVGTNEPARAAALQKVDAILRAALGGG